MKNSIPHIHDANNNSSSTEQTQHPEPIAIVGMGCRFPGGAADPQTFWNNLLDGKDCIIDVPEHRWDVNRFYDTDREKPGKMYVKSGGFLQERIDEFDALFFGVSPREAVSLDPQQRILMEVSWEALEDAGIDPDALAGTDTGVFVGGFMLDNKLTQLSPLNRHTISSNTAVGMTLAMLSNRISYIYDLRGPSISIDTACSSSLVALDQACNSMWAGNINLALVGGVNIMHRPEIFIGMCKGGFLAPDGRSKSFDERGDGYGRGEGAGIVVLKPLADAERDGDQIYAVIRATGCNQDGHTDGITVPNPEAQKALIRKVGEKANIALKDINYFEAHGTGTALGDPLEMSAIGGTVGQARDTNETCIVGSVKGSIGHLEAASGIAAVIKSALCLKYEKVPPQANLITLNSRIPFAELQLSVPQKIETLKSKNNTLLSGINSFGYGGTNACAILQNHIPKLDHKTGNITIADKKFILPLSAQSKPALLQQVKNYRDFIAQDDFSNLSDLTYSAGARRSHLSYRVSFKAKTKEELLEKLDQYIAEKTDASIVENHISEKRNKLAFVFTGMGPQWWNMGCELMQTEPVFLASVKRADAIFQKIAGWSILAEMTKPEAESIITETQIAQPANFVLQSALVDLWRSWGIEPAAVIGHSVGEVTTAYVSGILTLEEALLVSYHRSRIQKKAANQGSMLAVALTETEAKAIIAPYAEKVSIAAINGPTAITLAGDEDALGIIAEQLTAKDIFNRLLQVEVAYHSPTMDPLLDEIRTSLASLNPGTPTLPSYSTVTGTQIEGSAFDGEYWCKNVREPVYFFRAMERMIKDGYEDFLEVGPHPVLSSSIKECFSKHKLNGFLATSLKRKEGEQDTIKRAVAELYGHGYSFKWNELASDTFTTHESDADCHAITPQFMRLPTYPWQRERYWNDADESLVDRIGQDIPHAVLGAKQEGPDCVWLSQINQNYFEFLPDHQVEDLTILAGATYVEAALAAHKFLTDSDACLISDLSLHNALVIDHDAEPIMRTLYNEQDHSFSIHSYSVQDKSQHKLHATGKIEPLRLQNYKNIDVDNIKKRSEQHLEANAIYAELNARGLQYGPYFQGIEQLWRKDGEVLAHIVANDALDLPAENYQLHPTLLDACFQSLISTLPEDSDFSKQVYIPVNIRQLRHYQKVGNRFYCYGTLSHISAESITGNIILCDEYGNIFAEICGLRCQALRALHQKTIADADSWTYQPRWNALEKLSSDEVTKHDDEHTKHYVLFLNDDQFSKTLLKVFYVQSHHHVTVVYPGHRFEVLGDNAFSIDGTNKAHLTQLFEEYINHMSSFPTQIIYAWSMVQDALDPISLGATQTLLDVIKHTDAMSKINKTRLYVLTQNAAKVVETDRVEGYQQSPVIGLGRVAAVELPNIQCTLMDVGNDLSIKTARLVSLECQHDTQELELAFRNYTRYAYRLMNTPMQEAYQPNYATPKADQAFALSTQGAETNITQALQVSERKAPNENEIELQILAVVLQPESVQQHDLREVSARIVNIGENVTGYEKGEEVIACYQGALTNFITLPASELVAVKKPSYWSHVEAAPALVSSSIAYAALIDFAHIDASQSLLIIGADTPVGQAAKQQADLKKCDYIQVCANAKHNIWCKTSPTAPFELDSASLTEDLLQAIYRKGHIDGFDVIINVTGNAANLQIDELLAPYGKYIAITEEHSDGPSVADSVNLSATKTQLQLNSKALFYPLCCRVKKLLAHVDEQFSVTTHEAINAARIAAVDFSPEKLQKEKYPVVLNLEDLTGLQVIAQSTASFGIKEDATYLITGGFGGFGLGMAQWLVDQGAKHLVLVSRSGASTHDARTAVADLVTKGAHVKAAAIDIADEIRLQDLLLDIKENMPPLKGVFHAAGVLDDRELLSINDVSLQKVMQPKALGAWNLHYLTRNLSLDCFVLYSSISALIGNRNQGNYVAANVFLDALAHHRHAQGLAATSINWGALADVGMAANNPSVIGHLAQVGINAFTQEQALEAFARLLHAPVAQVGIFDVDWQRWKKFEPAGQGLRFSELAGNDSDEQNDSSDWSQLITQGSDVLLAALTTKLSELVAGTLKLSTSQIDLLTPINKFGLDSLMAMDLQMKVRGECKVDVSILELMKGNSITKLAEAIAQKMTNALSAPPASTTEPVAEVTAPAASDAETNTMTKLVDQLNNLDKLSEEELDALLRQELTQQ